MQDIGTEQLAELQRSFKACDSNGDGAIGHREFATLLHALDQDLSDDECLLAFELADADGDDSINFDEFMAWWNGG